MVTKPRDYDTAASYDSDFAKLPPGGYICEIYKMEETVIANGSQIVTVYYDIAEGEYEGYFAARYRRDKRAEQLPGKAKWQGRYILFPYTRDGLTNPVFKGLLTCVEMSNNGFHLVWPLNLDDFRNKKVGLLFREEEIIWDGKVITTIRPCGARSVSHIACGAFSVPGKHRLSEERKREAGIISTVASYNPKQYIREDGFNEEESIPLPF